MAAFSMISTLFHVYLPSKFAFPIRCSSASPPPSISTQSRSNNFDLKTYWTTLITASIRSFTKLYPFGIRSRYINPCVTLCWPTAPSEPHLSCASPPVSSSAATASPPSPPHVLSKWLFTETKSVNGCLQKLITLIP